MKKFLLSGVALLMSLAAMADFNYLEFKYSNGDSSVLAAEGLTILINDQGNLEVSNAKNQSLDIDAWDIVAMQFTNKGSAGIDAISSDNYSVSVYAVNGMSLGTYENLESAVSSLSKGVYVIRYANGETHKLIVGK